MPIKLLDAQQDLRKIGEIRIGKVVPIGGTDRRGKPKMRPAKLDKFRFTSASKPLLEEVAKLYGGEVQAWVPANGGPSKWEVFSEVDRVPVLVRGERATRQWFELNDGPRCVRVCDGETEQRSQKPCLCDPDGDLGWWDERECAPVTRLRLMLRDVPAIGNWLLTSKGRNAAETLPPMAQFLAQTNGYVPALLGIEERITYPEGKPPNRFMVPILEAYISPMELLAGGGTVTNAIGAGAPVDSSRKAIEAGRPDYVKLAEDALTADATVQVYYAAKNAGHLDDELDAKLREIGSAKRKAEAAAKPVILNATSETVDAEIVDDAEAPSQTAPEQFCDRCEEYGHNSDKCPTLNGGAS